MVEDIWSSADIDTLADTLSWLRSGSECCQSMSSTTEQNFIYEYARTQNSRKLEEIALEYEGNDDKMVRKQNRFIIASFRCHYSYTII